MKTIDMRFDEAMLKGWIGKKFCEYRNDPFDFTNTVTQIIGLFIDDETYALTNIQEEIDYFGIEDSASVFKLNSCSKSDIKSAFIDVQMIKTPINEVITGIKLVNETQQISIDGELKYSVYLTRAIIITAGGREISFEKDNIPFSEEIVIQRGYNLIEKCSNEKTFLDGWDDNYTPEVSRDIITI